MVIKTDLSAGSGMASVPTAVLSTTAADLAWGGMQGQARLAAGHSRRHIAVLWQAPHCAPQILSVDNLWFGCLETRSRRQAIMATHRGYPVVRPLSPC